MKKDRFGPLFLHLFFIVFSFLVIYPFWIVLVDSLDNKVQIGFRVLPAEFSILAYKTVLSKDNVISSFFNSVFRTAMGTVLSVTVSFGAAYALSKKHMPFNRLMTAYVIIPMFFGGGLIPFYLQMMNLKLVDKLWSLVLIGAFSGFNILVTRNYVYSIPVELEESALLDGASDLTIAFKVFLPLSLPIIATIALWAAVGHWNEYFNAMILIRSQDKQVLQVLLRRVLIDQQMTSVVKDAGLFMQQAAERSVRNALLIISTLPILVVYPFAQKYFVRGLTSGAVKG
jgi:putative aldouronate transport system permease protein